MFFCITYFFSFGLLKAIAMNPNNANNKIYVPAYLLHFWLSRIRRVGVGLFVTASN